MTHEEKSKQLWVLIRAYGAASEELGGVDGSCGWNAASAKQDRAEQALSTFINMELFK